MLSGFRFASILILFCVLTSFAFSAEVVVPFVSGEAAISSLGDGSSTLSIPGFSSFASPGDPALPYNQSWVLLPPNANIGTARVEIRDAVIEPIAGKYSVQPTPPIVSGADGKEYWAGAKIANGRNTAIYQANALYPSNYATMGYENNLGAYRLVPVTFWPYRYNPVTGELVHLKSGNVAIVFDTCPRTASVEDNQSVAALSDRLPGIAVNWQKGSSWYAGVSIADAQPATATPLAIITTSAIVSASTKLAAFVTHKTNKGFAVTVATEADWGGGTGDAAAENIRAWLKANYTTKAHYAILIGNPSPSSGDVPMKMLTPIPGAATDSEAPSDYYFADLTGNWDLNGNGAYGEYPYQDFGDGGVDRIPEVIVGRIPYYGKIADLDKILQKIISYETASSVGSWAQKALVAMKPFDERTLNWHLGEAIVNDIFKPMGERYYRVYESDYGLDPAPEKYPCNEGNVVGEWKNGYGYIVWGTHGWGQGAIDIMTNNSIPLLDDTKPAFTFQGSCSNAYPEAPDNIAYQLLLKGAIGTNAATRVSWYYSGMQSGFANCDSIQGMAYTYTDYLIGRRERCGDALFDMKIGMPGYEWANHVVFNLYGDPTVKPAWPTALLIDTASMPAFMTGTNYNVQLNPSGGTYPYKWSISSGVLPTGLSLNPDTGLISGTPTESGSYAFTAKLVDATGKFAIKNYTTEVRTTAHSCSFDEEPGWRYFGSWEFGTPTGAVCTSYADPTSGHTGTNVLGYNLSGGYYNDMTEPDYLMSSAFDCSNLYKTKLSFWRWLDVGTGDFASIDVSSDFVTWKKIWSNSAVTDKAWTQVTYDISSTADGCSTVYIRFGMGPTNASGVYPGWNIDDLEITGQVYKHVTTVPELKTLRDGTPFKLDEPMIVSAAYSGYFYMQQPDGYQGIKVWWSPTATEGAPVTLRGTIGSNFGQKDIMAIAASFGTPVSNIRPVGISLLPLGGSSYGTPPFGQPGLDSTNGLNNIGTLVKVWGRVTQTSSTYLYIDDGSKISDGTKTLTEKNVGVRVQWPGTGFTRGQFVTVVGISSCFSDGTHYLRAVMPRKTADIH